MSKLRDVVEPTVTLARQQPAARPVVSSFAVQRSPDHTMPIDRTAVPPPHGNTTSAALPLTTSEPSTVIRTLTGIERDPFASTTFEAGFRGHEVPVWEDLRERGLLIRASLSKLNISTVAVEGAVQYMVVAVFSSGEGHHAHDDHPGFKAWIRIADRYQGSGAHALGGETILRLGD